jgi:hypothetical protein
MAPQAGSYLMVNSISFHGLGGGSSNGRLAVYYSVNNFASSAPLGTATYNSSTYAADFTSPIVLLNTSTAILTGQQIATFSPIIIVRGGQTLSIRLYAWCSTASKYFTSKSMSISGTTSIDTLFSTSVKVLKSEKPASYVLFQNYPNPFNPSTTIEYQIPSGGTHNFVSLQVFDILGREVATLVNGTKPPGNHSVQWNAEKISSGVYFYCFHIGSFTETKKLLLLK